MVFGKLSLKRETFCVEIFLLECFKERVFRKIKVRAHPANSLICFII